jgi:hypothetical protein
MENEHGERFLYLIKKFANNPSDFAKQIEKSPTAISNVISGRNKAGIELIEAILLKYPQVSPEWLLLGKGNPINEIKEEPKENPTITSMWEVLKASLENTISDLRYTVELQRSIINGDLGKQEANELPQVEVIKLFPNF